MQVSDKGKLVYLNPPRTATTHVGRLMSAAFPDTWCTREDSGHRTLWKPEWEGYFVFQTVRSPFTRAVSMWRRIVEHLHHRNDHWLKYLQGGKISFEDLLYCPSDEIQSWWSWSRCGNFVKGIPRVNLIVHQENLEEGIKRVPGLKWKPARPNRSELRTPWYEHYNDRCSERVLEIYADDFDRYGYVRDFEQAKAGILIE